MPLWRFQIIPLEERGFIKPMQVYEAGESELESTFRLQCHN